MKIKIKLADRHRLRPSPGVYTLPAERHTMLGLDFEEITSRVVLDSTFSDAVIDLIATYAGSYAPVQSVAGKTGVVTLVAADIIDFNSAAVAAVLPITSSDVTDFAAAARSAVLPITSLNVSDFNTAARSAVLPITSANVSDFNAAAVSAVLPITSANVSDFNAAARAAVLPVDYINITNVHVTLANIVNVATNTIQVCDVGNVSFVTAY